MTEFKQLRPRWHIAESGSQHLDPLFIVWTSEPTTGMTSQSILDACAEELRKNGTDGRHVWTSHSAHAIQAKEWLALYNDHNARS